MLIDQTCTLEDCAFAICTAMENLGKTFVLVGGSAATYYCPTIYQSMDLDFCMLISFAGDQEAEAIARLGYVKDGSTYRHAESPYSLDLMHENIYIDQERITSWNTVTRENQILHVLKPEDAIRDRLLWYGDSRRDLSALKAAAGVMVHASVKPDSIRTWIESYFKNSEQILADLLAMAKQTSPTVQP